MIRPFVDYYRQHDISPVSQDISDLGRHFDRRESLYRFLGIPPRFVRDATVLEFGPGSGHNSIYTASLEPARYTLVDANPRGLRETAAMLRDKTALAADRYEIVTSFVEDFRSTERYDLVLAEGMLPFQLEPAAMTRRLGTFVAQGGLLVITCVDTASLFAETGRRLLADRLAPPGGDPVATRVAAVRPLIRPHLATLPGVSRSVDDWILDNITQPLPGRVFSFADAIGALEDDFEIFGSSPQFNVDLRWYKDVHGEARRFNERFALAYRSNILNLLDCRLALPPHDPAIGDDILRISDRFYATMQAHERDEPGQLALAAAGVDDLVQIVEPLAASTAQSLRSLARALRAPVSELVTAAAGFASHFGRGQQYASFVRKTAAAAT